MYHETVKTRNFFAIFSLDQNSSPKTLTVQAKELDMTMFKVVDVTENIVPIVPSFDDPDTPHYAHYLK